MKNTALSIGLSLLTLFSCQSKPLSLESNNFIITGDSTQTPEFKPVPNQFKISIAESGTLEEIKYNTKNKNGQNVTKNAQVYLPFNYTPNQKYEILYLMHGAGGNSSTLLGNINKSTDLKTVLDHLIAKKLIKPLIIVTPTFNHEGASITTLQDNLPLFFQEELRNDLIPTVESKYSTYSKSSKKEDLINARNYRHFGGFSAGSTTTWYVFLENLSYFKTFIPISGDCWAIEQFGGVNKASETAELLSNSINKQGFTPKDFFIFSATGTKDIAYQGLSKQIAAMKTNRNIFTFDYQPTKGNLYYIEAQDGLHNYEFVTDYLFDILPYIFRP